MDIKCINCTLAVSNCYLVLTKTAAIVIDPGCFDERAEDFLNGNKDKERLILLTHCHFDHIGGAVQLRENTGVKIAVSKVESPSLSDDEITLSKRFHAHLKPFSADIALEDNQVLTLGDTVIKAVLTPGHTKGSMCFDIDGVLFTGDTLFKGTFGRTDFPGGSLGSIRSSIKTVIKNYPDDTLIYPGHNEPTTVGEEKLNNPILR